MLPSPFIDFIPQVYRENVTDAMTALCDKADTTLAAWFDDILMLDYLRQPERCPAKLLIELGYWLSAGLLNTDSEATKREKITKAILTHKHRGTWENDAKIRIDAITGYSADVYALGDESDDAILLAAEASDPDAYWMTLQDASGTDDLWGWWLVGDLTEICIGGNIAIDCHEGIHVSTLTAAQILAIVVEIQDDVVPAYYRVFLGYVDVLGVFTKYAGGQIH